MYLVNKYLGANGSIQRLMKGNIIKPLLQDHRQMKRPSIK